MLPLLRFGRFVGRTRYNIPHTSLYPVSYSIRGYADNLDTKKARWVALKGIQSQCSELYFQYEKALIEVERKYTNLARPLFDRRLSVINGSSLPTMEEIEKGRLQIPKYTGPLNDSDSEQDEVADRTRIKVKDGEDPTNKDPKVETSSKREASVPAFWALALSQSNAFRETISDRDTDALKYLKDVRLEWLPPEGQTGQIGYKLVFDFGPNPFFENTVLMRTHYYRDEPGWLNHNLTHDRAEGTQILWKSEDVNLTKYTHRYKVWKPRKKGQKKEDREMEDRELPSEDVNSFFKFFTATPLIDEENGKGLSEDEEEWIGKKIEWENSAAEDLRKKIIPRAVDYASGMAWLHEPEPDWGDVEFNQKHKRRREMEEIWERGEIEFDINGNPIDFDEDEEWDEEWEDDGASNESNDNHEEKPRV